MNRTDHSTELFIKILTFCSGSERYFTPDMLLGDIINGDFDDFEWLNAILALSSPWMLTSPMSSPIGRT